MNIARRKRIWHAWQRRSPCCFLDDLMKLHENNDAFDADEYWWESDMLDRGEALPASFHPSSSLTLQNILLWWNIFQIFTYSSKYPSVICVEAANILQISSTSPLLSEVAIVSRSSLTPSNILPELLRVARSRTNFQSWNILQMSFHHSLPPTLSPPSLTVLLFPHWPPFLRCPLEFVFRYPSPPLPLLPSHLLCWFFLFVL